MIEKNKKTISYANLLTEQEASFRAVPHRIVEWLGGVNHANLQRVLAEIKDFMSSSSEEIQLLINSGGGATGIAMNFYDAMTSWMKPKLVTIGSGDVDSSGIIVFLAGEKRYLTKNTTMLFHLAGRTFCTAKRYTTRDMEAMLREDKLKDYQYASVVAERTCGKYTPEDILNLMANDTVITPQEAVKMGLAHGII